MKIISKYKDFYDYLAPDYNADITYVRNPYFITDNLTKKFPNIFYSHYNLYGYRYTNDISVHKIYFGIYPYIYSVPIIKIKYKSPVNNTEFYFYFVTENDLNNIITENDFTTFCKNKVTKYLNSLQYPENKAKPLNTYKSSLYYLKNIGEYIKKEYISKVENKSVFKYIKAPVFCEYNEYIINSKNYYELTEYKGSDTLDTKQWLANCSFEKLDMNILKIWFDELKSVNTYNNIENFLWSIKQETISEPSNKTKIINHGFDLKTSFRKM